jgi:hypothetical protein
MFCGGRGTEDKSDLVSSMSESASSKKKGRAQRLITVQIQVKVLQKRENTSNGMSCKRPMFRDPFLRS